MTKYRYEVNKGAAQFTIQRKDKRNAMDYDVMAGLKAAMQKARVDPTVKIFIITGEGQEAFCSGGDLSVFHALRTADQARTMLTFMADILIELFSFPKPTVAFLNGTAVGGGAELAAACDFRIGYEDIQIRFIQGTLGITTGWGGAAFLFKRLPSASALEMLITAEKIKASKAKEIGLLQKVMSRSDKALIDVTLDRYLNLSTEVLSAYKLDYLSTIDYTALKKQVYEEVSRCAMLWESEAHHNAVDAFRSKK